MEVATPVLIAGAGPVGLTLALELASHGVASVLVERNPSTTTYPKMDLTNVRSMELFDRLGLVDDIRCAGVPSQYSFDVIVASSLAGHQVGRWDLPSVDAMEQTILERGADGTQPRQAWQRISQIEMEDLLMSRCISSPFVDVARPFAVTGVEQDDDGVATTVRSSDGEVRQIRSRYVVACDGANSAVRRALGIGETGERAVVTNSLVHFRSSDLGRLHAHGQFWHIFFVGKGYAAIIAQDEVDTWTLHQQVPPDSTVADIDPMQHLVESLGSDVVIDEILQTSIWRPNVLVADAYRSGNVFLAGDAAHQVIPTGGYGMNTGIADAVDIGWKLAAVVGGWGGDGLLETYEAERRPVAIRNRDWSLRHLEVHLQGQQMADLELLDEETPAGIAHRAALTRHYDEQRGENESWGVELGYGYADSPIVVNDEGPAPEQAWDSYRPTTWPGSRAPHVPLRDGRSPLDAFRTGFTLVDFTAGGAGAGLADEAERLSIPMTHLRLAGETAARAVYERDLVLVRPDGHVAWRASALPADGGRAILRKVAGRSTVVAASRSAPSTS